MAKKQKKKNISPKIEKKESKVNFFIKHPNWTIVIILLALLLLFYHAIVFEGKTLLPPDTITAKSYKTFVDNALKDLDYPLWNPYIFSGMPSFASLSNTPLVNIVDTIINYSLIAISKILPLTPFMRIIVNYLFLGLLMFLLLNSFKVNRYAALFAAVAVMFIPQFVAFSVFGHNSKILTIVLIPLIFWAVNQLLEKKNLLYFALAAMAFGLQLMRAHVQVCYYTYLLIGLYFIYYSIIEYKDTKKFDNILKSFGLLAGVVFTALLLSSVLYISIYEYSHYSIRGGGTTGGLSYDYASSWSFAPAEMITFLIPSFYGFGGATYWGKMPFTDYPLYMGIVVLFFAGLGLVIKRGRYNIFFGIAALFSLIISFGKHLPILYNPMFKFLPFFNKFRIPSMVHIILDISVIIIAALGFHYLMELKESANKKLIQQKITLIKRYFYIFSGIGVLLLFFIILGKGTIFGWMISSGRQLSTSAAAQEMAYQMALKDSVIMLIFIGLSGFLSLFYMNGKLKQNLLGIAIIVLLVVDLWLIDFKLIDPKSKVSETSFFKKNDIVTFLEKQSKPFRIFPVKTNQPGEKPDNWYMYHELENIYGYHAAKLKIYQESLEAMQLPQNYLIKYFKPSIDAQGRQSYQPKRPEEVQVDLLYGHQAFLNMLNVKYIISAYPLPDTSCQMIHRGSSSFIYENKNVLPRAFFVDEIKTLQKKDDIFKLIKSKEFDPSKIAILEKNTNINIEHDPNRTIEIVSKDLHKIKIKASVSKPALMVLSEIYYPAGWKAFVDGEKTEIYKTNYILRSIFLQPGDHEIEFVYKPLSFKLGLIISFITLVLLMLAIFFSYKRMNNHKLS